MPLEPGERPLAVTVAAVVAAVLGVANLVALIVSYDPGEGGKTASTLLGTVVLARAGGGDVARPLLGGARLPGAARDHDRARLPSPAHSRERGRGGARLAIIALSGTLFWFLVKALARLQMPTRPGAAPRD